MVFRLDTKLTHDKHGEHVVDYVLYGSGWRAHREDGSQCDDANDYEETGRLYRLGNLGPLLDFAEVCEWLSRKGWAILKPAPPPAPPPASTVRVTSIKYSRGETIAPGVVEHKSKRFDVVIKADSRDPSQPALYRVWVSKEQVVPGTKPRQRKFYDGFWRFKDAKEAAIAFLNDDPIPHSGTKPAVLNYDTYDPAKEGYGSPEQWRATFNARIDQKAAEKILGDSDAWDILGLDAGGAPGQAESQAAIKKAYRKQIAIWHPDKHANSAEATTMAMKIQAAYELLRDD